MRNRRYPRYPDDTDYTTNSPSYYDDLARKQKLIEMLAKKIWEYEETLDLTLEEISNRLENYIEENDNLMTDRLEKWDLNLEKFPENVELLLQEWLSDGTLDHIINETIFNWKADKTYVDSEIERLDLKDVDLTTQLAQMVVTLDITSMGVMADGVTNQTIAINDAINYAVENGISDIYFPAGTYLIDAVKSSLSEVGGIRLESNIHLILDKNAILKALPNSSDHYSVISINGVENVSVTGGQLQGDRVEHTATTGEWGFGIQIYNSKNVDLRNVTAEGFWGDGFYMRGAENVSLDKCIANNNRRQGMSIAGGKNINVTNSKFMNTSGIKPQSGVDIEPSNVNDVIDTINFTNCEFLGNADKGILMYPVGGTYKNINVINCKSLDNGVEDIRLTGVNLMEQITIQDSEVGFISVGNHRNTENKAKSISIINNVVENINVRCLKESIITKNRVKNNIYVIDYVSNLIVSENHLLENDVGRRIAISYSSVNSTVKNVHFLNNIIIGGEHGLYLLFSHIDCVVKGNTIYNVMTHGITISGVRCIIDGNRIVESMRGIEIQTATIGALIINNALSNIEQQTIFGSGLNNEYNIQDNNMIWDYEI